MKPNEIGYWDRFWEFQNYHRDFDSRIANSLDEEEIEAIKFFLTDTGFSESEVNAALRSYINHNPNLPLKEFFDTFKFWLTTSYAQRFLKKQE